MSMVINTIMMTLTTQRHLTANKVESLAAVERLASGKGINTAMDDAAGLVVSNKVRTKIIRLQQAGRHVQDGISLVQTTESALEVVSKQLTRIKALAMQVLMVHQLPQIWPI